MDALITPVILSGGAGTRLWPLSRAGRPKQMLALTGAEPMLRTTARRVADRAVYAPPVVVAPAAQAAAIEAEVEEIGTLILEPCARNTAAAIALAALAVTADALLLVLPSDHMVADPAALGAAVRRAAAFAAQGWIVTFGMKAERAETGYGYVERGPLLGEGVHEAAAFVEKPDAARAAAYVEGGRHDWNGGIFLMRADVLVAGLERHAPAIIAAARRAMELRQTEGARVMPDAEAFAAAPSLSIDYALMEKAEKVAVAPVAAGWSDVGSFAALHEAAGKDADGNAFSGDVLAVDARDCLIRSEGPLVAALGIEELVIVATGDAVLVARKGDSQRVRELVERLKAEGRGEWT
jgi:mannose-1-phosphate guanylyltransferase/mannose-1-phosphate guanylyltransferase/mannose-6-phosphate isomerase